MVAALFIALQLSTQGVLGPALASSKAPLADTARIVFGAPGGALMLVAALLAGVGYLVADVLSSPRAAYALAECGQFPRIFARVSARHATPAVAISAYCAAAFALAASGSFRSMVVLASSGTLVLYLVSVLAVLRLRARGVAMAGTPFVAPFGAAVPLLTAAIIVWLLSTLSLAELASTGVVAIASASFFAIRELLRRKHPRPA